MRTLATLLIWASCTVCQADYVVEFTATWCGPCQKVKPIVEQLRREGYDIRPVDIDERPDLKAAYGVKVVPTFVYVRETLNGSYQMGRIPGRCTAAQLRRLWVVPQLTTVGSTLRCGVYPWGHLFDP